jgi:hypothetical protein
MLAAVAAAEEGELLQTGSDAPYVHRITLYDHDGTAISPADEPAMPYSPRMTCGKCHPYDAIAAGWHFNAPRGLPPGRPGEPWLFQPDPNGPFLAISDRDWPLTHAPADVGLSHWDMLQHFGRHMPGGAYGEPDEETRNASPQSLRWDISGPAEIDCMICHSADQQHDPAVAAQQIEFQNYKWIPTVALGLGVVRGEAAKAPDFWDPYMPPNPDQPEAAGPILIYNEEHFDADDRVLFNITRDIPDQRCNFCHTVNHVGADAPARWAAQPDVHTAAGLKCVDCHGHGLDHRTTRGYLGEVDPVYEPQRAALTCRGCHLGEADADVIETVLGGRLNAPHPEHRGFPDLHFERLTCTACHSGPWPQMQTAHFQTAMAHELGLASRERTDTTPPDIAGPVFANRFDGKLAPQRAVEVATDPNAATTGIYRWAIAHNVRPARQSLGIRGCTDCHSNDGVMFFGRVILAENVIPMDEFHDYDPQLAGTWALTFAGRPAFKWFAWICAALVAFVVLRGASDVFHRQIFGVRPAPVADTAIAARPPRVALLDHAFHVAAAVGIVIQATTAFGSEMVFGEFGGWALLGHMCGATLFIIGLTGTALRWARRCRLVSTDPPQAAAVSTAQRWTFWLSLVVGLAVMIPMLAAMLPIFGYAAQHALVEFHEKAALAMLVMMAVHTFVSLRARAASRKA